MSVSLLIRRAHLYLAMLCLPWMVMYGVSAAAFTKPFLFPHAPSLYNTDGPEWTLAGSWAADVPLPESGITDEVGASLMALAGEEDRAYSVFRTGPERASVEVPSFWKNRRYTYFADEGRLELHTSTKYPHQILLDMHERAGYERPGLHKVWAFMVDLVALALLGWMISGLYMWWQLPRMRLWGALALGAGALSFVGFLLAL